MSVISIFQLVSVAEETVLSIALSETTKTGLLARRPISIWLLIHRSMIVAPNDSIITTGYKYGIVVSEVIS